MRVLTRILCMLGLLVPLAANAGDLSRRELLDLAMSGRYDELESALSSLQRDYERAPGFETEDRVEKAFVAFRNSKSGLEARLVEWRNRKFDSCSARLALGNHNLSLAEAARGYRWTRDTNAAQFRSMEEYLRTARESFESALTCNISLTPAWSGLVQIARLTSDGKLMRRAIERGLDAQPSSLTIRTSTVFALAPKWGGSFEAVDAFVAASKPALSARAFAILEGDRDLVHADELVSGNRLDEALVFQNAAVARADHWSLLLDRGDTLYRLGRVEAALADFNRAIAKRPDSVPLLAARARAFEKLGRTEEALADINAALAFDDRNPDFLEIRARLNLGKLGRPADGVADTTTALALGDQRERSWVNHGHALRVAKKDPVEARKAFLRAIELEPDAAPAWYGYGLTLYDEQSSSSLDAFDHYVYLCKRHGGCPPEDLAWLGVLVRSPVTYFYWPRVVFRVHLMGLLLGGAKP